jgi:hypothetical protein
VDRDGFRCCLIEDVGLAPGAYRLRGCDDVPPGPGFGPMIVHGGVEFRGSSSAASAAAAGYPNRDIALREGVRSSRETTTGRSRTGDRAGRSQAEEPVALAAGPPPSASRLEAGPSEKAHI